MCLDMRRYWRPLEISGHFAMQGFGEDRQWSFFYLFMKLPLSEKEAANKSCCLMIFWASLLWNNDLLFNPSCLGSSTEWQASGFQVAQRYWNPSESQFRAGKEQKHNSGKPSAPQPCKQDTVELSVIQWRQLFTASPKVKHRRKPLRSDFNKSPITLTDYFELAWARPS